MYRVLDDISLFYLIQGDHPMILAGVILSGFSVLGILITLCCIVCLCWKFHQIQQGRQQLQLDQNAPNDGREN